MSSTATVAQAWIDGLNNVSDNANAEIPRGYSNSATPGYMYFSKPIMDKIKIVYSGTWSYLYAQIDGEWVSKTGIWNATTSLDGNKMSRAITPDAPYTGIRIEGAYMSSPSNSKIYIYSIKVGGF